VEPVVAAELREPARAELVLRLEELVAPVALTALGQSEELEPRQVAEAVVVEQQTEIQVQQEAPEVLAAFTADSLSPAEAVVVATAPEDSILLPEVL
jgi:hypothetical protein